jgi:melibiose permease
MEEKQKLTGRAKLSYALGAVGKDMVYMLSASYVQYYFQDVMGVSAIAMGTILLIARVFDAFNDPIMGVIVARPRPAGASSALADDRHAHQRGGAVSDVRRAAQAGRRRSDRLRRRDLHPWGVTYTMMDIPYWSMIPAFTEGGKEREGLTTLARSCAGVGSAIITIVTILAVHALGGGSGRENEILGFKWFSLIVAVLFVGFTVLTCVNVKERSTAQMETSPWGRCSRRCCKTTRPGHRDRHRAHNARCTSPPTGALFLQI